MNAILPSKQDVVWKRLNTSEFLNSLFSKRKNMFVCVHVHAPTSIFSTWLIISFTYSRNCMVPTFFTMKSAQHKVGGLHDAPALSLPLPPHTSHHMDHLSFPEVPWNFPLPCLWTCTRTLNLFFHLTNHTIPLSLPRFSSNSCLKELLFFLFLI